VPDVTKIETKLVLDCARLLCDFAQEVTEAWKGWLTGSLPMTTVAIATLVDPEWIRLPVWAWALAIFVAGLLSAMFRVYRELRKERDELRQALASAEARGPFLLVPVSDRAAVAAHAMKEIGRDV
jgi:hypothetical protein